MHRCRQHEIQLYYGLTLTIGVKSNFQRSGTLKTGMGE